MAAPRTQRDHRGYHLFITSDDEKDIPETASKAKEGGPAVRRR